MARKKLSEIQVLPLLKQTFSEWSEDKAPKMAASLAFYTATSIAPMVIAAVGILTLVVHKHADPAKIHDTLQQQTGSKDIADTLQTAINKAAEGHSGLIATILGIVIATVSASAVFAELQDSLNTVWEVRPKPGRGIVGMLQDRFLSVSMVLGIAFLLLVSTVLTTVVGGLSGKFFGGVFGSAVAAKSVLPLVTVALSTAVVTVLFAALFKVLPDVKVAWRDVWLGAFLTAVLFQVGKWGLSEYVLYAAPGSAFGAFGSIVVMLVWVYYSAYILFFGAEFTQVYANQYGSHVVPASNAEPLTEEMRAHAGVPHAADSASHPDRRTSATQATPSKVAKPAARPTRTAAPVRRVPVPVTDRRMLLSTPGMRTRGAIVLAAFPIAVGIVVGRFAFLRLKAGRVHVEDIRGGWRAAADNWKKLAKLFVSKSADRYAMTHGPARGAAGASWSDLAEGKAKKG